MIKSSKIIKPMKAVTLYQNANVAVKASIWFAFCSVFQKGISIITMPIFTRLMPTIEYGEYTIFQTWYNILAIIVTLNIHAEIFSKGLIDHSDCKNEFSANQGSLLIVLSFVFFIIYNIFKPVINHFIGLPYYLMVVMICEILGNAIIGLWYARKRFDFDYRKIVLLTIVISLINPIIGIVAVINSANKAQARIISNAVVPVITGIILYFDILILSRNEKKLLKKTDKKGWWKNSIILSLPLVPHYLSLVLLNQADKLMINHYVDTVHVAIYSVAHSAGLLMTIVNTSINGSFVPWAYNNLKVKEGRRIKEISNGLSCIVLAVSILFIWFAPETVKLLAASQYHEAIWCLVPIAASVYFFFIYTLIVDIEIYYGENKYVSIASISAAAINILLNYTFIPIYGYLAAGYTTLVSYFATMVMHWIFLKIICKKHKQTIALLDGKMIVLLSIILIMLSILAMLLYNTFLLRLLLALFFLAFLYYKKRKIIELIKTIRNSKIEQS